MRAREIEDIEAAFRVIARGSSEDLESDRAHWSLRNRERLRFRAFRARGLPNGSGAVESSVRRGINLLLKVASIACV